MKIVVWLPTKKAKIIPIPKDLPAGSLDDLKYWCNDSVQWEALIVFGNAEYQVKNMTVLMKFGEKDIKTLGKHKF